MFLALCVRKESQCICIINYLLLLKVIITNFPFLKKLYEISGAAYLILILIHDLFNYVVEVIIIKK